MRPAWLPDPFDRFEVRFFDGCRWTEHVAAQGAAGLDVPCTPAPPGLDRTGMLAWLRGPFESMVRATAGHESADTAADVVRGHAVVLLSALVTADAWLSDRELVVLDAVVAYGAGTDPAGLSRERAQAVLALQPSIDFPDLGPAVSAGGAAGRNLLSATDMLGRFLLLQAELGGTVAEEHLSGFLARTRARLDQPASGPTAARPTTAGHDAPAASGGPAPDLVPDFVRERDAVAARGPALDGGSLEEVLAELDDQIGLEEVKAEIRSLANLTRVQGRRRAEGLPNPALSHHLVFTGSPGTGKTTVARLVSRIYAAAGVLREGHIVETSRAGLVAGYVGQTAIKTEEVFRRALGGTLFIDEAYSLRRSARDQEDFGLEAIDTLVKLMEDHRDEVVVIVAGYPKEMTEFVSSNPGLESRFKRTIHFPDYRDDELVEIFEKLCRDSRLLLAPDAVPRLGDLVAELPRGQGFANGRTIRRMFEVAVGRQADRLAATRPELAVEDLVVLERVDLAGPDGAGPRRAGLTEGHDGA